jgi:hypothetical protein
LTVKPGPRYAPAKPKGNGMPVVFWLVLVAAPAIGNPATAIRLPPMHIGTFASMTACQTAGNTAQMRSAATARPSWHPLNIGEVYCIQANDADTAPPPP